MMYHYVIFRHQTWDLGRILVFKNPSRDWVKFNLFVKMYFISKGIAWNESGFPNFVKYVLLCINSAFQVIIFQNKTIYPVSGPNSIFQNKTIYPVSGPNSIFKNKTSYPVSGRNSIFKNKTIYPVSGPNSIFKNKTIYPVSGPNSL